MKSSSSINASIRKAVQEIAEEEDKRLFMILDTCCDLREEMPDELKEFAIRFLVLDS